MKKTGENSNAFQKSCQVIVEANKDLKLLFKQADEIIGYILREHSFSRIKLMEQLEILAGLDFAKVVIFALGEKKLFTPPFQLMEKMHDFPDLYNYLKFLVAKYTTSFEHKITQEFNEFGWRNITHFIVNWNDQWNPSYLIEYHIKLNNNSKVILREDSEDMIQFVSYILDGILEAENQKITINQKTVEEVMEKLIKLKD